jgi:hypothetical protein
LKRGVDLYDDIFNVDYSLSRGSGKCIADLSFTFLHWKLIELLQEKNENFDLANIS